VAGGGVEHQIVLEAAGRATFVLHASEAEQLAGIWHSSAWLGRDGGSIAARSNRTAHDATCYPVGRADNIEDVNPAEFSAIARRM